MREKGDARYFIFSTLVSGFSTCFGCRLREARSGLSLFSSFFGGNGVFQSLDVRAQSFGVRSWVFVFFFGGVCWRVSKGGV